MPPTHFSVTVLAIRALAIANGQLGVADGVNCPAMWAVKTIAMAEFPSPMHSGVQPSRPADRGRRGSASLGWARPGARGRDRVRRDPGYASDRGVSASGQ